MTTAAPPTSAYVRGAAPSALGRPLRTSLVAAGLATIATFAAVLIAQTHQENARLDRLASAGIPVLAHVTKCVARASGTGITGAGATCHATFTLDGHRYLAALHANSASRHTGALVRAVTTRSNPSDLTVGTPNRATWTGYALPATLLLLVALGLSRWLITHSPRGVVAGGTTRDSKPTRSATPGTNPVTSHLRVQAPRRRHVAVHSVHADDCRTRWIRP